MNRCRALFFSALLVLTGASQPARADTSSGDGGAWLLLFGGTIVTGINLLTVGLSSGRQGSETLGMTGAVIGTTLTTYSLVKDIEDAGFFAGCGLVIAGFGAASFVIARQHDTSAPTTGLHLTPCIVPGNEHAPGLELSYRW